MIALGTKVRDRISGFTGVAASRHEYLYGCTRYGVLPIKLTDGKPMTDYPAFDEPQLEVLKEEAFVPVLPPKSKPGGPRRDPVSVNRGTGR